jgi:hypothetical protein
VLGWPGFTEAAAGTLVSYIRSQRRLDPTPLLTLLMTELDRRSGEHHDDPELVQMLNVGVLEASMLALEQRFDTTAVPALRHTLDLIRDGVVPDDPQEPTAERVRQSLARVEALLLKEVRDWVNGEQFDTDDLDKIARVCARLEALRNLLIEYDGGTPQDRVGLAYITAIRARMLGTPCPSADMEQARHISAMAVADEHLNALVDMVSHLLTLDEHPA